MRECVDTIGTAARPLPLPAARNMPLPKWSTAPDQLNVATTPGRPSPSLHPPEA